MSTEFPASRHCAAFQTSLEFLGARWTAAVIRVLFFANRGRFSDLLEAVPRLSSRMLAQRLEELVAAGIVERVRGEAHSHYALTAKGRDLREVFEAVERWNAEWYDNG